MKNIKLIEVPSEIGAGTRGASLGIDAIKVASLDYKSTLFAKLPSVRIKSENKLLFEPIENPYAKRIKGIVSMYQKVANAISESIHHNFFPIVISGDHSNAGATIAGIKIAKPNCKLGVIWIDAHADLHTPYTTPSGNVHGMPLATAINEDNLNMKIHEIDEATKNSWSELKNFGNIAPKISPEDIVFISLRDYEKEEKGLIDKYAMKVITTTELREKGIANVINIVSEHLKNCTDIYISFDVDSLDASISKGTGTPVCNGLKKEEAETLIFKLMQHNKISCFEITEVNPTLDKENEMAEIAFNILQKSVDILTTT